MKKRETYWFWVWLMQITVPRSAKGGGRGLVWRNLILINAHTVEEAYAKAEEHGLREHMHPDASLTFRGKPAVTKFLGVEDMGLVHDLVYDEIHSGVEVLSTEKYSTTGSAKKRLRGKVAISLSLRRELLPYVRANGKTKPRGAKPKTSDLNGAKLAQ